MSARRLATLVFLLSALPAVAAPLTVRVRHGLGGRWSSQHRPVTVDVSVAAGHVEGDLALVTETARGPLRQVMRLKVDGPAHQLFHLVELVAGFDPPRLELDGQPVPAEDDRATGGSISAHFVVVVVGDAPGYAAAEHARGPPGTEDVSFAIVQPEAAELPENPFGYGDAALVVLRGRAAAGLEPAQARALVEWVHLGGQLVVSPGLPPASLRDVPWLEPLLPASTGGGRTASVAEMQRELRAAPDRSGPLDAIALAPLPGALSSGYNGSVPLVCARQVGAGRVEMIGIDETALGPAGLRAFLTVRLGPHRVWERAELGSGWERQALTLVHAGWAASADVLIAAGLLAWLVVLWVLSRLPATGTRGPHARSPLRRLAFRPAVGIAATLALLCRGPARDAPRVDLVATLEAAPYMDAAAGQALLAVTGPAGRAVTVPLTPGRVLPAGNSRGPNAWRAFFTSPTSYRLRVGPEPALEGLTPPDGLPCVVDLQLALPAGGAWSADLRATGHDTVDGQVTNGTTWPLEAGWLVVDGHAAPLPEIPAGGTCHGPFTLVHPSLVPPPAGLEPELASALPDLMRSAISHLAFPADGLTVLPVLTPAVIGRIGLPAAAVSPGAAHALALGVFWLPLQPKRVTP